jgi:DNA-binding NarL/FixJ family response regulator
MEKIKLAIVDDEDLLVDLLQNFFNKTESISVVCTANDGQSFLDKLPNCSPQPQIVLMDLRMKEKDGLATLSELKKSHPELKTIIMSSHYKKTLMGYMLKVGVNAFIPKGISPFELERIIKEVGDKDFYFLAEQIEILRKQVSPKAPQPVIDENQNLTEREKEVLLLICQQKTATEIAESMFISKRTVEGHRSNILIKTGAKNTAGLVIYAAQNKLFDINEVMLL